MSRGGATRRSFCALALIGLAGCAGDASFQTARKVPSPPPDPHTQMAALEKRIYELIEQERIRINAKAQPLKLDPELAGVARKRSDDMALNGYMAHTAPNGETSASLIMNEDSKFQGLLGENIAAQHYLKAYGVDVNVFAKRFVDTWLASPSHRDNLAYGLYNRTGVGAAVSGDTVYVTQLFATDLGLPTPPDDSRAGAANTPKTATTARAMLARAPHR